MREREIWQSDEEGLLPNLVKYCGPNDYIAILCPPNRSFNKSGRRSKLKAIDMTVACTAEAFEEMLDSFRELSPGMGSFYDYQSSDSPPATPLS